MFRSIRQYMLVVVLSLLTPIALAAQVININTADAGTIAENLNGIGVSKAQAIVEYRKLHGDFHSADDLVKVKGIGLKLIERNSAVISFGGDALGSGTKGDAAAIVPVPLQKGSDASAGAMSSGN